MRRFLVFRKSLTVLILAAWLTVPPVPGWTPSVWAQYVYSLPRPGAMVTPGTPYAPELLKGVTVHPENPFRFDFLVDSGETGLDGQALDRETIQLVKYYLAGLTVPEQDLWVNLSPYERHRMIPEAFGQTEMGRDMLGQDYVLKQLMASLIYPDGELGRRFWDRVYKRAYELYGTTEIPVNTFNNDMPGFDRKDLFFEDRMEETIVRWVWAMDDPLFVYIQSESAQRAFVDAYETRRDEAMMARQEKENAAPVVPAVVSAADQPDRPPRRDRLQSPAPGSENPAR